jgi:hypothetical protein
MPNGIATHSCIWVWDEDTWDQVQKCPDGMTCAQDPNKTGIVGQDGDMYISLCVAKKPPATGGDP